MRIAWSPSRNLSVFATKSVSHANYTIVTVFCESLVVSSRPIKPSVASLSALLSAKARPFFLSRSFDALMSPPVSTSTAMQSFSGDPVRFLRSFTWAAVGLKAPLKLHEEA